MAFDKWICTARRVGSNGRVFAVTFTNAYSYCDVHLLPVFYRASGWNRSCGRKDLSTYDAIVSWGHTYIPLITPYFAITSAFSVLA